jgi:very-short-patch-repair endonuclease
VNDRIAGAKILLNRLMFLGGPRDPCGGVSARQGGDESLRTACGAGRDAPARWPVHTQTRPRGSPSWAGDGALQLLTGEVAREAPLRTRSRGSSRARDAHAGVMKLRSALYGLLVRTVICARNWAWGGFLTNKKYTAPSPLLTSDVCLRLARSQQGLLTRAQLLEMGLSTGDITRGARAGLLRRLGPRVFEREATPDAWRRKLRFATLWLREGVVSHRAAGLLHRLDGVESAPVELSVTSWQRSRRGVKVICVDSIPEDERTTVEGFAVTTVPRTLVDLASKVSEEKLAWAVEHAWRRGDTNPQELRFRFDHVRERGMKGMSKLDAVLRDCERRIRPLESALEIRMWRLLARIGLRPEPQLSVWDEQGELRIDFAFMFERVAVETMGKKSHEGDANLERDCRRATRLSALGWIVVPVTWDMLEENTKGVLQHLRRVLRLHDPRFTRRGFVPGQLGLPGDYLIRPVPQFRRPLPRCRGAVVVLPTPRRPVFEDYGDAPLHLGNERERTPAAK